MRWMLLAISIVFAASFLGCNPTARVENPGVGAKKSEEEIKHAFSSLQSAIKAKDVDKIWSLMAKDTQGDVEKEGKKVQQAYANLPDNEKPAYEKKVGLAAKEMSEMSGKFYVKSNIFFSGEIAEMPDSKFDKAEVAGETTGTVHYIEDQGKGQKEKRSIVREDGQWKFVLEFTPAVMPDSKAAQLDPKMAAKIEQEVKKGFEALQSAVKAKDVEKLWNLLAKDARDESERQGKAAQDSFAKLPEGEKAAYATKAGLSADELAKMTGKLYAKSNTFYTRKTGELIGSKLDKVVIYSETSATVHYVEDDGDKVTMPALREDGQWKFALHVTKAVAK